MISLKIAIQKFIYHTYKFEHIYEFRLMLMRLSTGFFEFLRHIFQDLVEISKKIQDI